MSDSWQSYFICYRNIFYFETERRKESPESDWPGKTFISSDTVTHTHSWITSLILLRQVLKCRYLFFFPFSPSKRDSNGKIFYILWIIFSSIFCLSWITISVLLPTEIYKQSYSKTVGNFLFQRWEKIKN